MNADNNEWTEAWLGLAKVLVYSPVLEMWHSSNQASVDKAIELSECPCDPRRKQERAEQQVVIC